MYKIAFVILHYENLNDTKECLNALIQLEEIESCSIIVVDNASIEGRIDLLTNTYKKYNNIYFIRNNENLGFAKGNNVGYRYAKYKLNSEVIILMNNDIIINQACFINKLVEYGKLEDFEVAAPDVISLVDNHHQNPVPIIYHSIKDVNKMIIKFRLLNRLTYINGDEKLIKFIDILKKRRKRKEKSNTVDNHVFDELYQLHGCFLIFSKSYIKKYDGLYDQTFMYGEEDILKFICIRDRLRMKYLSDLVVYHKEGSSTKKIFKKRALQRRFFYKCNLDSCKILKKIIIESQLDEFKKW